MTRLSSPVENIKSHYTVVVVGSGYGGGIAASRLARAGQQVCVLERGKEFRPGEYPDTEQEVMRELQIDTANAHLGPRSALYDLHVNKDINVFVGCGLGGTSLVNANVSLPPERRVLDDPLWPAALRADVDTLLAEGIRRAQEMLKPTPHPEELPLAKLDALKKSAEFLGAKFERAPINVTFEDKINHVGVEQHECVGCGDCVTGCNYAAKNTVLMNYLPDARNHGAEIYTQVTVRQIERKDGRWLVHYQLLETGREAFNAPTMFVGADIVILAAGTLGSTEILLRSKSAGLALSDRLGERFSGNADFLGFSYNSDERINGVGFGDRPAAERERVGPTITGMIDIREQPQLDDGILIEDGAIPGGISGFIPLGLATAAALYGKDTDVSLPDFIEERRRELESLIEGPYKGAVQNTQTYLVMGHDDAAGKLVLENDRLRIKWPGVGAQPIFQRINQSLTEATRPLGGTYLQNPTWSRLTDQNLTTVHPLGGCVMADDAGQGVVNHKGQVFAGSQGTAVHDGLYVLDGSMIPRPLGVNPLLTISGVAERGCALLIADRGWSIDYGFLPITPAAAPPPRMGVRFTETMKGWFSTRITDDFKTAAEQGKRDDSRFQFILTIHSDDLETMLSDEKHQARMVGNVIAPALSAAPLTVTDGVFNLFVVDPDQVDARRMIYRMRLSSLEGKTYFFHGFKAIRRDSGLDMLEDTTTLFITVFDGEDAHSPVLGKGILKIEPADLMRQMSTLEITNAPDPIERLKGADRFGKFFLGAVFEIYGGILSRPNEFGGPAVPRKKRPLRLIAPEVYPVRTSDAVELRLTRYKGGTKGPVILAPGFGTSTLALTLDTIETNLPEYLFAHGFDVWLFDYRASPALASSRTQFSLDEIATDDYPAAVARVLEATHADSVQAVVHCVASVTFLMGMMAGLQGVRSAVCSSFGFFPVSPTVNEVKAGLGLASFMTVLGVETITTDYDESNWLDRLSDAVLKLATAQQPCSSPVCRRIQMIYGEVYRHDQLNAATHDAIHEMFGIGNVRSYEHLTLMIRKGQIVDKHGNDVYLPQIHRLKIPISFIHGAENRLLLIDGTKRSFRLLCEKNGPKPYVHITFPDYAHMDLFIGRNASKDIFPEILAELEKTPS